MNLPHEQPPPAAGEPAGLEAILTARARLLARRRRVDAARPGRNALDLLIVSVGEERVAVPVAAVQEILRSPKVTPLPGSAAALAGICGLRGRIFSVMNLARLLGIPQEEDGEIVLFLRNPGAAIAVQVQGVEEISAAQELRPLDSPSVYFRGLAAPGVPMLDLDTLVRHPDFTPPRAFSL